MANFRYKVCKGQKVVAVSTTLREAEAEAKRVGGTVYMIGQHNPARGPISTGAYGTLSGLKRALRNQAAAPIGLTPDQLDAFEDRLFELLKDAGYVVLEHNYFTANNIPADVFTILRASALDEVEGRTAAPASKPPKKPASPKAAAPKKAAPAAPAPAAPAPAPKKAKDDPSRFPLRPEGVKEYDTPQNRNEEPSGETYLVTLMAPKCLAPVAFFTVDSYRARYFEGYSPDLTRGYVVGYFDSDQEHPTEGYPRIHMSGVSVDFDKQTGVGPACYMAGPFAAIRYNNNTAVFSSPAGGSFGWRSAAADRAWRNLVKAGVAYNEDAAAPLQEDIDAYDILKAGRYPLSGFGEIDNIDPHWITVEGTGPAQELQVMTLAAVLNDKRTLHIDDNLYEKILRSGALDGVVPACDNGRPVMSPAPELWDEIDLLRCTPDEVEQMAAFCSVYGGMEPKEYLTALREAVASNPTYVEGSLDALFMRNGVIEEPKPKRKRSKKNPGSAEATAQRKHNKASYWDEDGSDGEDPQQNPSSAEKLSANQQRKYLGGLKGKAREARAREILYRREHRSDKPFKTDKGQQTKPSSHAKAFAKKYGRAPSDTADAAKLAGVRKSILDKVYARGMAAWQTGHRPGASQHAWAMARVESFLTGGPTSKTADADLAREAGLKR